MHPFVVHHFSASLQQDMQPPISKARFLSRQLHQAYSQPFIAPPGSVAITRYRHRHQKTRPPLAEGILSAHLPDSRLQDCELHPFFRITDWSASLSKLKSATNFFRRPFSSRSCFPSGTSFTSIPPYFAFQP